MLGSKTFWKAIVIVIPFLSFKETTGIFTTKINSIFHNYISARSVPQILSVNDTVYYKCTFCFPNFLIIGLCSCSANYWFGIFLFLIADLFASVVAPPAEDFLSKDLKTIKEAKPLW